MLISLLNRARDSPDDEEKEILSSTSGNVREIWDGHRVIRQTGPVITKTFVYDSAWNKLKNAPPFVARENATEFKPTHYFMSRFITNQAPNMILNIDGAISKPSTIAFYAIIGLVVQIFVIAFNGLAVYHWR